jgi:hypothetical protein
VNRFLITGTISKGRSSEWPPVSDEIVEDLRERLQLHPYKISVQELQPADYHRPTKQNFLIHVLILITDFV